MKIVTFRLRPWRALAALLCVGFLLTGLAALRENRKALPVWGGLFSPAVDGSTPEARRAYLASFGWQTEETPAVEREVLIPREFDETYLAYNELQKQQGFDLARLHGKTVTQYGYAVLNPPEDGDAIATLLVRGGKIVGADLASTEQGGYLRALG